MCPRPCGLFDVYPDGRVLLGAGHERVNMMASTPDGKSRDLSWSGWSVIADVSQDGKQVLFDEQSEFAGTNYTVAIRGIDGSPPIKLGDGELAKFSPDGKSVGVAVPGQPNHFLLLPTGAGEAKDIPISGLDVLQRVGFLPDGRVLMVGSEPGHGIRCFVRALEGGPMKAVTGEGNLECRSSPDSRQLAAYQNGDLWVYDIETTKGYAVPGRGAFSSHTLAGQSHDTCCAPGRNSSARFSN